MLQIATNCYNTLSQVRKMQAMRLPCRSRVWGRNNNQNVMWCLIIFDISMVRFWKADWYCWHPQSHGSGLQPGLAPSLGKRKKVGHGLKTGLLMGETSLESWTMLPVSHSQQGLPVWREELSSSRFEAGQDGCGTGQLWSPVETNVALHHWKKLKFQSSNTWISKCILQPLFA